MIALYKDPPAGNDRPRPEDRLPVDFNGYTMNDPDAPIDDGIELIEAGVTPITDQVLEQRQGKDGMEIYQNFKGGLMIALRGFIKKPTLAELFDEQALMAEKFDPALLSRRTAVSTDGFLALNFRVPTTNVAAYVTGQAFSFYLARTLQPVTFGKTKYDGYQVPFKIEMVTKDPSRFQQGQKTLLLPTSDPTALDNSEGSYPSWPIFQGVMVGAGSAAFTVTNQSAYGGSKTLTLDLSTLVNGDVLRVDFERKRITVNGLSAARLYVSGDYWQVEPRITNLIDLGGTTNIASRELKWHRAFSA